MAKKKIYAVRKGKSTGIFETWEKCKSAVEAYPGAEYKGFGTLAEANAYLSGSSTETEEIQIDEATAEAVKREMPGQVIAYVDGSFDEKIGFYAFGCVIIKPNNEIFRESGNGNNPESAALRNVTGEMLGAMFAVKWCEINEYSALQICYDYTGIEMWATGAWKTNTTLTKKYAEFMKDSQKKIHISFTKIAAHTGDKYNEEADKLAKAALLNGSGIPKIIKENLMQQ